MLTECNLFQQKNMPNSNIANYKYQSKDLGHPQITKQSSFIMLKPNKIGKAQTSFALAAKDIIVPDEMQIGPFSTNNANSHHVTFSIPQTQKNSSIQAMQFNLPQSLSKVSNNKEMMSKLEKMESTISKIVAKKKSYLYSPPPVMYSTKREDDYHTLPTIAYHNNNIPRKKRNYITLTQSKERLIGINEYLSDQSKKDEILKVG